VNETDVQSHNFRVCHYLNSKNVIKFSGENMCIKGTVITNAEFMSSFSFHRPQKHYEPPEDVADRINFIYKSITGLTSVPETPLNIPEVKFKILNACFQEFQYSVPNSLLSTMHTVGKKN
jgi:hypothetical protein